jgi:hypothetical protein
VGGNPGFVAFPGNVNVNGVLTVGASSRYDEQSNYSPTAGPVVPNNQVVDVVAPSHRAYCSAFFGPLEDFQVWSLDIPGTPGYNTEKNSNACVSPGQQEPNFGTNNLSYTGRFGGTSAATPLVAGICALVLSVDNSLTCIDVFNNITCSAQDVGPYTYTGGYSPQMGNGRANAFNSLMNLCIPAYNITWTIPAGQTIFYQAGSNITNTGFTTSTASQENQAGNYISLLPGFQTAPGAVYYAHIAPCTACITNGADKSLIAENDEEDSDVQPMETERESLLKVYPNPTTGDLRFQYLSEESTGGNLVVADMMGRVLQTLSLDVTGYTGTIDLGNYPNGIYLVNLFTEGKLVASHKVIVAH